MHFQICNAFQAFTKLKKITCGTCTHLAKFLQDAVSVKAIYTFLSPHKNQTTLDEPIQMYLGLCGSQNVLAKPIHALLDFYRIQTALTEPLQLFTGICGKQIVRSRSTHFFLGLCWMQTDLDNLINTIPCLCIMQIMLHELIHVSTGFCTTETALSDSLYAFPDQYRKKTTTERPRNFCIHLSSVVSLSKMCGKTSKVRVVLASGVSILLSPEKVCIGSASMLSVSQTPRNF